MKPIDFVKKTHKRYIGDIDETFTDKDKKIYYDYVAEYVEHEDLMKICQEEKISIEQLMNTDTLSIGGEVNIIPSSLINVKDLTLYRDFEIPKSLKNLKKLTYDEPRIIDIKIPDYLTNLEYIHGNIKNIPNTLTKLKCIETNNNIYIPPAVGRNLEKLVCRNNIFTKDMINLKELECSNITKNYDYLINLESLKISYSDIIHDTFTKLKKLCIYHSNIDNLPSTLNSLMYLRLNNTRITKIPDTYVNLETLIVHITYDMVDKPEFIDIPDTLINLKDIVCNVETVISDKMTKLESLAVKNIKSLPESLINLEKLIVSSYNIKSIPCSYKKLKYLTIKGSKFINIDMSNYPNLLTASIDVGNGIILDDPFNQWN